MILKITNPQFSISQKQPGRTIMRNILRKAIIGIVATVALAGTAAAQQINYNFWIPPGETVIKDGFKPFSKRVTEATDGKTTFQLFTAGQMMGPFDTLPAIRDGGIQGGFVLSGFYRKELKHSAIFDDTIAQSPDAVAAIGAVLETFNLNCPECQDEFKENNVIGLGGQATAPYSLMCTKKVESLEDVKGLRIRGSTDFHFALIEKLGANGVNVPFSEISQAFERGNVDCFFAGPTWVRAFGLLETIKYRISKPTFGVLGAPAMLTFQRSAFDSWDQNVKDAIVKYAANFSVDSSLATIADNATSEDQAIAAGMKNIDLSVEMAEFMKDFKASEAKRLISSAVKRGVDLAVAERLLEAYNKNYAIWEKLSADIGTDNAKFVAALNDRVYSKLKY